MNIRNIFQIQRSDLIVMGVFLILVGLVLLFVIDFLWGVYCLGGAFFCFWQATGNYESDANSEAGPIEDD